MATWYVRKTGSNSNAGTSAGAAWATLQKALTASNGVANGDTVYVGAGVYREFIAVGLVVTANVDIIADVDGSQTGDAGEVRVTPYDTNDTTLPSASTIPFDFGTKSYFTFKNFVFVGGKSAAIWIMRMQAGSHDINFLDCLFHYAGNQSALPMVDITGQAGVSLNTSFKRCIFFGIQGVGINITMPIHTSEYNANVLIENCRMLGGLVLLTLARSGTPGSLAYGFTVQNNTVIGPGGSLASLNIYIADTGVTMTNVACLCYNNIFFGGSIRAGTTSMVTEDYNYIATVTPRTNITAGTHSKSDGSYAPLMEVGQAAFQGRRTREFCVPTFDSPLLGFGSAGTPPTVDALNRPRPAGGQITNAIGALERHNTAAKETTTVDAGGVGYNITGPGDQDIEIPVSNVSTTISVKVRYDSGHAATNKPQVILLANAALGITTQTLTMSAAVDTWETLTFTAQTPSATGVVKVRLVSRSAASSGKAFFDTAVVS